MPLFQKPINHTDRKRETRGSDDVDELTTVFLEIFEENFVPSFNDLSTEDKATLKTMFNDIAEDKLMGDILCECDKDAMADVFTSLT